MRAGDGFETTDQKDVMEMRPCRPEEAGEILDVVNDGARAYRGVIPDDCWHEPYMTAEYLGHELADGVVFWGVEAGGRLAGVMGIQEAGDVTLIRHAYTRSAARGGGLGRALIVHLLAEARSPALVGTWNAATWAVRFYERNGFRAVTPPDSAALLGRYWKITDRQTATSLVLASDRWFTAAGKEVPEYRSYFAYGSNMDAEQMARRCPNAYRCVRARLDGRRFVINRGGYATVVPAADGKVHGVLWKVSGSDLRQLDRYEGTAAGYYARETVTVEAAGGDRVSCLVYVAAGPESGSPKAGYLERVVEAGRRQGLPDEYLRSLGSWRMGGERRKE